MESPSFILTELIWVDSLGNALAQMPRAWWASPHVGSWGWARAGEVTSGFLLFPLRCNGATLHACNATRDAICAAERNPVPGKKLISSFQSGSANLSAKASDLGFAGRMVCVVSTQLCCCRDRADAESKRMCLAVC